MNIIKEWENNQELNCNISNLEECFEFLTLNIKDNSGFIELDEETAVLRNHHNVGQWIRNTLELWKYCSFEPKEKRIPIVKFFNQIGIYHPDDMSSIILTSYHRFLNKKDIDLKLQAKHYIEFWNINNPAINKNKW